MQTGNIVIAPLILSLLAGCVSTVPPGKNGGTEQLRASLTPALEWADVPDDCIAQLSTSTLAQIKGITANSPRDSIEMIQRRQRIRTAAARDCPGF